MAYVSNDPDEEEKQQQPNGGGPVSPTGGAVHLAPSSGVGSTSGTSSGPAQKEGGQFATLNDYLTANQGQAAPLADKITGQIGDQYNKLDQASSQVISGINDQVTSAPGYTASDNALIAKESAAPVSFANDAGNVAAFQKQLTDSYSGPLSAEGDSGFQKQQAAVNSAISQGNANTANEAGRQNLVKQATASPTAGATALNSAILSQDPNYLAKVQDAYKPFNDLVTNLGTGAQNINKTIASEQADAANAVQNSTGAITGQITGLNSAVNNQLTGAQQNATTQNAAVNAALSSGKADPTVLSTLGISQDQWNSLTAAQKAAATADFVQSANGQWGANSGTADINLSQFNNQIDPNAAFNTANVATKDQYDQAAAFQKLLGGLNLNTPQAIIDQSTASQAGTAPTSTNKFDYTGALNTAQSDKSAEMAAANAYVAALQSGADEAHAQQIASQKAKEVQISQNIGTGVGTVAGGVIGTIFPVLGGTAGGAAIGSALGTLAGNSGGHEILNLKNEIQHPNAMTVADIATAGLASPIQSTIQTVKDIFCFHPFTLVEMANGGTKQIFKIQVGDETRGGKVMATTRGVGTTFYWYDGVLVTGKHAVKEDGVWVRIENSKRARVFKYLTEVVCNLVTTNHRIWSNGIEFADEHETDAYENLGLDDSLAALNANVK